MGWSTTVISPPAGDVADYLASLRLEGFDTQPTDVDKPLPTREAVLAKYRNTSR